MLEIACGAAKNKFKYLKQIIGIAIDAPKFFKGNSEDFLLMNCENWSIENEEYYKQTNKIYNFFNTPNTTYKNTKAIEFPNNE